MNGDGSAFTQLTDNAVDDFTPVWSLGPWVSRMTQPRQGLPRPGVCAPWARFVEQSVRVWQTQPCTVGCPLFGWAHARPQRSL
jgi:hypothetical protein